MISACSSIAVKNGGDSAMKLLRASEVEAMSQMIPEGPRELRPNWLEGPSNGGPLDVGLVTLSPGGEAPPHVHIGGQVIVVTSGRGFVQTGDERLVIEPGDVVICPPGEVHMHGALEDGPMAHLTVTTGGYSFPEPPAN
jgi:quercetin dioxygenase-like cupin family protein